MNKEVTPEQQVDYLTKANEVLRAENLALKDSLKEAGLKEIDMEADLKNIGGALDDAKELLTEVCAQSVSPNHKYGQLIDKIELFLRSLK